MSRLGHLRFKDKTRFGCNSREVVEWTEYDKQYVSDYGGNTQKGELKFQFLRIFHSHWNKHTIFKRLLVILLCPQYAAGVLYIKSTSYSEDPSESS